MSRFDRINVLSKIRHLHQLRGRSPRFNLRSVIGSQSVFELLEYGNFNQLNFIAQGLKGTKTMSHRSGSFEESDVFVPLNGSGNTRGMIEFEVEREDGATIKQELKVRVFDAAAGSHELFVDGQSIGDVIVDHTGFGRVIFSSQPKPGESALPAVASEFGIETSFRVGQILEGTIGKTADSTDNTIHGDEIEFDMFGSGGIRGDVNFEVEPEDGGLKTELRVRIRNVTSPQNLTILIDGVAVGQLAVSSKGRGEITFSTDPNNDEVPFPSDFPPIQVGSTVRIGNLLEGSFPALPDLGPNGNGSHADEVEYRGALRGSGNALGSTRYQVELEDNQFLEHQFRVAIKNGVAGSSHDIRVAGIKVGAITLNQRGRGRVEFSNRMNDVRDLSLPSFFPQVTEGTRVDVGNILSGFLRLDSGNSPSAFSPTMLTAPGQINHLGLGGGTPRLGLGLGLASVS